MASYPSKRSTASGATLPSRWSRLLIKRLLSAVLHIGVRQCTERGAVQSPTAVQALICFGEKASGGMARLLLSREKLLAHFGAPRLPMLALGSAHEPRSVEVVIEIRARGSQTIDILQA